MAGTMPVPGCRFRGKITPVPHQPALPYLPALCPPLHLLHLPVLYLPLHLPALYLPLYLLHLPALHLLAPHLPVLHLPAPHLLAPHMLHRPLSPHSLRSVPNW